MTVKCSICHSPMYAGNICPKCSVSPAKEKADNRLAGTPCSAVLLSSVDMYDGGWMPIMTVDHQSFTIDYIAENKSDCDWYCDQIRTALKRAGCRIIQPNIPAIDYGYRECHEECGHEKVSVTNGHCSQCDVVCPRCNGTGNVIIEKHICDCPDCFPQNVHVMAAPPSTPQDNAQR